MNKRFKILFFIFLFVFMPAFLNAEEYSAVITGSSVRIRVNPSTSDSKILFTVNSGTSIVVLDKTTVSGTGCANGWLKIKYKEKEGYVCSNYVRYIDSSYSIELALKYQILTGQQELKLTMLVLEKKQQLVLLK